VQDLVEALRTKDTDVLYESLIALQKIRDESAGPRIAFLLRDLDAQGADRGHRDGTGLLRNKGALADLADVLKRAKRCQGAARRAGLARHAARPGEPPALPAVPERQGREDARRAAEGFARLRDPADAGG
jgi:hypothetical protein